MADTEKVYDFAINQASLVEALEEYKNMEDMLLELKDRSTCIHELTANYSGEACSTLECNIDYFFNEGDYAYAYEMVCKVRELMESILPEVNALLARCAGLREQLGSDEYVEPVVPTAEDVTPWNDGILTLDYNQISIIKSLCEDIAEENGRLTQKLKTIMLGCQDIIEGTDKDLEDVTDAMNRLNRVLNYKESFELYEKGVRALDEEIALQVRCTLDGAASVGAECGADYISDDYLYMSEDEIDALFEDLKANGDEEEMMAIANKIFEQEPEEWNEGNAKYVALVMEYSYENGNSEMFQKCLEEVCCGDCTVYEDTNKIDMIMNELDPETQGELYYTLNRINLTEGEIYEIEFRQNGDENQVYFRTGVPVSSYYMYEAEYTYTINDMQKLISPEEEAKLLAMGFTSEQVEQLRLCAITDADVSFWDHMGGLNYDEAFGVDPRGFSTLGEATFTQFSNSILYMPGGGPEEFQTYVNSMLGTNSERCFANENCYYQIYLEILNTHSETTAECMEAQLWQMDLVGDSAKENELLCDAARTYAQPSMEMKGFWSSLDIALAADTKAGENNSNYYGFFPERDDWTYGYGYESGDCTFRISEIQWNGWGTECSQMKFDIELVDRNSGDEGSLISSQQITVSVNWDHDKTIVPNALNDYRELDEQRTEAESEFIFDSTVKVIGFFSPEAERVLNSIETAGKEGDEALFYDILTDEIQNTGNPIADRITKGTLLCWDIYSDYRDMKDSYDTEYEALGDKSVMDCWGSNVSVQIGERNYIVYEGVFEPETVQNFQSWKENGLSGLPGNEWMTKDDIDGIENEIEYLNEDSTNFAERVFPYDEEKQKLAKEYLNVLIRGDADAIDILEMDREVLMVCLNELQRVENSLYQDNSFINIW
ncbi:MAG: hypothetical protein E7284_02565 [Lachnospiraceae bacterium]|nr:hypothetical protein [Lachnospiraceae bacterium]